MKARWQRRRIADIAQHSLGKMLDKVKNRGELRPYLRNLNVRWFEFDLSDVSEMRFLPAETERYSARKGDVLICEGGYPGRAAIWDGDEPIFFQKALHRVRFHVPEHNRWFLYYLRAKDLDGSLKEHFGGTGIQHFTGEALARFEIPLPPLSELQRIVGILDEAFEGIATARAHTVQNSKSIRALFEAFLSGMLTCPSSDWARRPLGEICEILDSRRRPITKRHRTSGDIPYYGATGIQDYVAGFIFDEPLVLVGEDGARWGPGEATAFAISGKTWVNNHAHVLRPDRRVLLDDWLIYLLNQSDLTSFVSGLTVPKLNQGNLREIPILLPPLPIQQELTKEAHELRAEVWCLESLYRRKLAALDELKQSLLHQAFTGAL